MIEAMTVILGIASKENVANVVQDVAQKYINDPSEDNWKKLVVSCIGLVLKDEQDQTGGGLEAAAKQLESIRETQKMEEFYKKMKQ